MADLEGRLRRGLQSGGSGETGGAGVSLRSEVDRRVRRHARHQLAARVGLFAFGLLLLGAGAFVLVDAGSDGGSVSVADDERGWLSVTDPDSTLTAEYPEDWFVQTFDQQCTQGTSGVFISATAEPISQDVFIVDGELRSCRNALPLDQLPDDYVAVYIHGPLGMPGLPVQEPITDFPLEIDRPEPAPGGSSTSVSVWTGHGEPDGVEIYVGPFATKRDVDTAIEIVATIRP